MKIKEIFKIKSKRLFINHYILPLVILMAICCLGIGYAAMNVSLDISGTLGAKVQDGIFISNVDTNGDTTAEITYSNTMFISTVTLPKVDGEYQEVTYDITIFNNSGTTSYYYSGTVVGNNYYSNENIGFKVDESLVEGELYAETTKTFTITFYDKGITDDNKAQLTSHIKFIFTPNLTSTFAVYSATDNSLRFYNRDYTPTSDDSGNYYFGTGDTGESLLVSKVYSDLLGGTVQWSGVKTSVTKVIFEDEITPSKTASWFEEFTNVETIDLEKLNTSNVTDMSRMFRKCPNLKTLTFGENFDTSNVYSMDRMFNGATSLTSLDLSNFNTTSLNNVNYMFEQCSSLTEIKFNNNFITSNMSSLSGLFSGCSSLKSIDLSGFNTINVTTMAKMFNGASSLTSIDLSSLNTSKVKDMSYMFYNANKLTYLNFGENFDTSKVENMWGMFAYLQLVELDLSGFDTSNVTDMGSMFSKIGGVTLSTLDLSGFNTSKVTSMNRMFSGANGITTLDLSSFETNELKDTSYMFEGFSTLKTIYVDSFVIDNITSSSYMFSGCKSLVGGNGTVFDSTIIDKTYARIDGGTESPGYFTLKTVTSDSTDDNDENLETTSEDNDNTNNLSETPIENTTNTTTDETTNTVTNEIQDNTTNDETSDTTNETVEERTEDTINTVLP